MYVVVHFSCDGNSVMPSELGKNGPGWFLFPRPRSQLNRQPAVTTVFGKTLRSVLRAFYFLSYPLFENRRHVSSFYIVYLELYKSHT